MGILSMELHSGTLVPYLVLKLSAAAFGTEARLPHLGTTTRLAESWELKARIGQQEKVMVIELTVHYF
jgi:hypothetical protein